MSRKNLKKLLVFILLIGGLIFGRLILAADFGTEAVNNGLSGSLSSGDPRAIISRIINIALGFLGVIAVSFIVYGGFIWMTSSGSEEKVSRAKNILKNAVIGLIIIVASWGIATFIISNLNGAINGDNVEYENGSTISCGCGGWMSYSNGSWSECIGSDCSVGGGDEPISCSSSQLGACNPVDQICSPNDYCDHNDCLCKPKGGSGDSCNADSSGGVCQADNNLCGQYLNCNPETCLCQGSPVITGVSPLGGFCSNNINQSCFDDSDCDGYCNQAVPNGAAGNFITIVGKNFGEYSDGISRVVFEGNNNPQDGYEPARINSSCVDFWTDNQIIIAVPDGASSGPISVVGGENSSDSTNDDYGPNIPDFQINNIIRPGLCYLSPSVGALSSEVVYQGINLYNGEAYFGNYENNVLALESVFTNEDGLKGLAAIPNIKSGDSGSFVENNISGNKEKSNYLLFTKEPEPEEGPFISSFSPNEGNAGQYVTIYGDGFGGARGLSQVYFDNTEAVYVFPDMCANSVWKDNQIIVKVPSGLPDGAKTISVVLGDKVIDTQKLNPNSFRTDKNLDLETSLCKIEPENGPAGTPVILWGEYFGRDGGEGLVKFNNNKSATGTIEIEEGADVIRTEVPLGAITGPVKVIKNSGWGNELNFAVGECTVDSDCGTDVCCPQNTYKKGRCVDTLKECFVDIPNSVFEWNFSTGFGDSVSNPYAYSCSGLASYFGSCQTGDACPNSPGSCSPYLGGGEKVVGSCDISCSTVPGCNNFGPNNCSYDISSDKCLKNGEGSECDLSQPFSYELNGLSISTIKSCNNNGNWEITTTTSCPAGWARTVGNKCIDAESNCAVCSSDFSCEKMNTEDVMGRCVSEKLCVSGAVCKNNPLLSELDKCVVYDEPSCDCCCSIGQDARDCCAPLKCEGSCGADTGKTDNVTLGFCSGCASAGGTTVLRDAACNCLGHTGQFCDINDPSFPTGACVDCSKLDGDECREHSSSCCLDSKGTATPDDDICRGGASITGDSNPDNNGYCAYYNCSSSDPSKCASNSPVKIGDYNNQSLCETRCADLNPCLNLKTFAACQTDSRCCFDSRGTATSDDDVCRGGSIINTGADAGYCAYYNCSSSDPSKCASNSPVKIGDYADTDSCSRWCQTPPTGPGLSCAGETRSTCAIDKCDFPGFDCFSPAGTLGVVTTGCGTCCCKPAAAGSTEDSCSIIDPNLICLPDKGECTGVNRGLCCGCSKDSECGSSATVGCGNDTCCQARPEISGSSPEHLTAGVCRNAVIKVDFNQLMDFSSFNSNILLLEERNYEDGVCPAGTFVTGADLLNNFAKNQNWLGRLIGRIDKVFLKISNHFGKPAFADIPSADKLYCSVPGSISEENIGSSSSLVFSPSRLLSAGSNYYLVIMGDADLNSQSGILSLAGIGFNGKGYWDEETESYVEGGVIKFNNKSYINSHIIKFSTLSGDSPTSGICAIDYVSVEPESYLFKTSENNIDENDINSENETFDTKADKDKVFTAWAYSYNNQILQPVSGYFWDWKFELSDSSIATMATSSTFSGLALNKAFVSAKVGVTDAEAKVTATIDMSRFSEDFGCISGSCSCRDDACLDNCCNVYGGGNGFNKLSNIYIFLCNNPWPPANEDGYWSPWVDNCQGVSADDNCADYNYKFYYCRDAGEEGTLDDLPAITRDAVIKGIGTNLICSSDNQPCANSGEACGQDANGDGVADGICIWSVLKESYFFREAILSAGEITSVEDQGVGGTVSIAWRSNADSVGTYKIYYSDGTGSMLSKEIRPEDSCILSGSTYNCSTDVSGLTDNISYVFKVSVISVNKTESELSNEISVIPTDNTPASTPKGLSAVIENDKLIFSWEPGEQDASYYRLYHGPYAEKYGESFDSSPGALQMSFAGDQLKKTFNIGEHYLALTAIDSNGNESGKSLEINFAVSTCNDADPNCLRFIFFENILTNIDFERSTASGLPEDWSYSNQNYSSVKISEEEHLSGKQSVLIHQDPGHSYPGKCSQIVCGGISGCTWDNGSKTCNFNSKDECHKEQNAVYSEGETFCWGNTNRVMWAKLAYNLNKLPFKEDDNYAINFYYKGNVATAASVGLSASLGWPSQCVHFSYVGALKTGYSWKDNKLWKDGVPVPLPLTVNPCVSGFGAPCSDQNNYCCAQSPAQTKCYGAISLPKISSGEYSDWSWYYYPFSYNPAMASWLKRDYSKMMEIGVSIGYNSTGSTGTNLYIDDFTVKRIYTAAEIKF